MNNFGKLCVFQSYVKRIVDSGNAWNILASLTLVVGAAVFTGALISFSGNDFSGIFEVTKTDRNLLASIWSSIVVFVSTWGALLCYTSLKRSRKSGNPVDIDTEAQCFALPFTLIFPVLILIRLLSPLMENHCFSFADGHCFAIFTYILLSAVLINMLALTVFLTNEDAVKRSISLNSNTSIRVAERAKRRVLDGKFGDGLTFIIMFLLTTGIFMYCGYYNLFGILKSTEPITRGFVLSISTITLWFVSSYVCGVYRYKNFADYQGMKTAILSIGKAFSYYCIPFGVICALRVYCIPDFVYSTTMLVFDYLTMFCVVPFAIFLVYDVCGVIHGLFVYKGYLHSQVSGRFQNTSIKTGSTTAYTSKLDDILNRISGSEIPSFKRLPVALLHILSLKRTLINEYYSDVASGKRLTKLIFGLVLLLAGVIGQGIAVSAIGKSALSRFMRVNSPDIDFLFGMGSTIVYVLLLSAVIYGYLRLAKQRLPMYAILSSVGVSLFPLTLLTIITSCMPDHYRALVAGVIYPCTLIWALGYLVLDLGLLGKSRFRLLRLPLLVGVILISHFAISYSLPILHLSTLRTQDIPVIAVRDTIADEFPISMNDQIGKDIKKLENVDLVDVRAVDFIDQVMYSRKVRKRYYKSSSVFQDLSPVRIRAELTSNAGWMRYLYSDMMRVTKNAKNPTVAVKLVRAWLDTQLVELYPLTWPFGEKFDQAPITTLICRRGNQMDAAILMIAALRASGVAARIKPVFPDEFVSKSYTLAEYYDGENWIPCYPKIGMTPKPKARPDDLGGIQKWLSNIPKGSSAALSILVDDVWYPYCVGRKEPRTFTLDLAPGTYMLSYEAGETCHLKKFNLRSFPASNRTAMIPTAAKGLISTQWVDMQDEKMTLYMVGEKSFLLPDKNASDGRAIRMPGKILDWATQVRLDETGIKADANVTVYVSVKATLKATSGKAFTTGIYDVTNNAPVVERSIKINDIKDSKYHDYNLGTYKLQPGWYVYVAPPGNGKLVENVFVDRCFVVKK